VIPTDIGDPAARMEEIDRYAAALSRAPGAARVDAVTGSYADGRQIAPAGPSSARFGARDATWLSVVPSVEPYSDAGEHLAKTVRSTPAPFRVLVTGNAAELVDSKASLFSRLPLAAGLIALATFVLLFLMFGSILVPVKALILNVLSLSATFGALVWIFQDGHLSGVLDFTPTGTLPATVPLLLFCLAFGLSMDYEVFLLSRIKEEHDRTHDNTRSVAVGLERTGRIVTAAAVIISVVFIAFATSGVSFIKIFGLGLTIAVLMDAFVIRATLVPAFMRIAGEANWWAPGWLRRIHQRIGISETEAPPPEGTSAEEQVPEPVGSR
jgi:RND superfamily putative drug exporter